MSALFSHIFFHLTVWICFLDVAPKVPIFWGSVDQLLFSKAYFFSPRDIRLHTVWVKLVICGNTQTDHQLATSHLAKFHSAILLTFTNEIEIKCMINSMEALCLMINHVLDSTEKCCSKY